MLCEKKPSLIATAAVVGKTEGKGPLKEYFDKIFEDTTMQESTWEKAESKLQGEAVKMVLAKSGYSSDKADYIFAGDLLNQCSGSSFALRDMGIPFLGQYGACSTMAQTLSMASFFVEGGIANYAVASTSSHFCAAERQFRFPLEYGGVRPPTAQRTVTGAGAILVGKESGCPYVNAVTVGRMVDLGITDANNMGAAMAPAACSTITAFLEDTGTSPEDYDVIVTGDLGSVGSKLLYDLTEQKGVSIRNKHADCGLMIFDRSKQDVHAGGSGCGCAASVLCSYFIPALRSGRLKNILFVATGAYMSATSAQQGESIPGIAHLLNLRCPE